jgi:serine/threonine protein kinase
MSGSTETFGVRGSSSLVEALPPGTIVTSRYRVKILLGRGGSAVVYAAHDTELSRDVALKFMSRESVTTEQMERFRREAKIVAGASNERLVTIYDIERDEAFFAMELVRGGSLRDLIAKGPIEVERAIELATDIALALQALHVLGIVHRDVKPANLLLTEDGRVKLADFGLALRFDSEESRLTSTGNIVGTFDYIPPEQALGSSTLDARADLYSFGVVLFEMLTGRLPFERASSVAILLAHIGRRPPEPRSLRRDIPHWLNRLVLRLIAKDPRDRYPSAEAVIHDLRRRRSRIQMQRRASLRVSIAAAIALVVGGGAWYVQGRQSADLSTIHLSAVIANRVPSGSRAVGKNGSILWSRRDVPARYSTVVRRGGLTPVVATILGDATEPARPKDAHLLSFLDARDGSSVLSVTLPPHGDLFPSELGAAYDVVSVKAGDVDGDGWDEVAVTHVHASSYPSYTSVHDLKRGQTWMALAASGHHPAVTFVDLNGDGRKELLLAGISNRMGWAHAVAAISLPVGDAVNPRAFASATPDWEGVSDTKDVMLWYALVPAGATASAERLVVDEKRRRILVRYSDYDYELTYDGFSASHPASNPAGVRQAARKHAYHLLRNARQLSDANPPGDADLTFTQALQEARVASDIELEMWIQRLYAKHMVRTHRIAEATRLFESIFASDEVGNSGWDAGTAFLFADQPRAAASWFRRGLLRGSVSKGRSKIAFLHGAVYADIEEGQWDTALRNVETYENAYGTVGDADWFRAFVTWRSGGRPKARDVGPSSLELYRYWALEFRVASGEGADTLLPVIKAEKNLMHGLEGFPSLVESEVLRLSGDTKAALAAAADAYDRLRRANPSDIELRMDFRAHLPLARTRYARLLRRSGQHKLAARVERGGI